MTRAIVKLMATAIVLLVCARTIAAVPLHLRHGVFDIPGDTNDEFVSKLSRILASFNRFLSAEYGQEESLLPLARVYPKRNLDLINSLLALPRNLEQVGR